MCRTIRAENIQPGERLPSERDPATKLGVSRTAMRARLNRVNRVTRTLSLG